MDVRRGKKKKERKRMERSSFSLRWRCVPVGNEKGGNAKKEKRKKHEEKNLYKRKKERSRRIEVQIGGERKKSRWLVPLFISVWKKKKEREREKGEVCVLEGEEEGGRARRANFFLFFLFSLVRILPFTLFPPKKDRKKQRKKDRNSKRRREKKRRGGRDK